MRQFEVLGRARRRCWSDAEKVWVFGRVGIDGRTVADVAREADLPQQHIYQWRQEMRRKGLWPVSGSALFAPVDEETAVSSQPSFPEPVPMIEILRRNVRHVCSAETIYDSSLARLIFARIGPLAIVLGLRADKGPPPTARWSIGAVGP